MISQAAFDSFVSHQSNQSFFLLLFSREREREREKESKREREKESKREREREKKSKREIEREKKSKREIEREKKIIKSLGSPNKSELVSYPQKPMNEICRMKTK